MNECYLNQVRALADAKYDAGKIAGKTEAFRFVIDEISHLYDESIERDEVFDLHRLVIRIGEANLAMVNNAIIVTEDLARAEREVFGNELH